MGVFKLLFVVVILFCVYLIFKGIKSYKEYMTEEENLDKETIRSKTLGVRARSLLRKRTNDEFEIKIEEEIKDD